METYREHIGVKSASSKSIFESAHKAFAGIEDLIDSRPNDEQVYDRLQANINGLKAKNKGPVTIKTYFIVIKQYLHYRGIKLDPMDIRQSLNFPKKQVEELRPLELDTFRKILKACSAKREMLYLGAVIKRDEDRRDGAAQEEGHPHRHGKADGKDTGGHSRKQVSPGPRSSAQRPPNWCLRD